MKNLQLKNEKEKLFHDTLFIYAEKLINIAWDYIENEENELKTIYAIGTMEMNSYSFDTFYNIENKILENHQTNNQSFERASYMQDLGIEVLEEMITHFKSNDKVIPTQIKIEYSFITKQIKYDFEYDLIWSNKEEGGLPSDTCDIWVKEIRDTLK